MWNKPGSTELSPKIKEHRAHALAAFSFIQCIFESNNTSAVGQIIVYYIVTLPRTFGIETTVQQTLKEASCWCFIWVSFTDTSVNNFTRLQLTKKIGI